MIEKRIFVSHSSADKDFVDDFVNEILIGGLGYHHKAIVYTSGEGMGIESGADWRKFLKKGLLTVDVIILIITSNYKSSEICMNEMGASWATDAIVLPMIVEPINYKSVGVLAEVNQVEKLNSSTGLDNIYDSLTGKFTDVETPAQARWTTQKKKFLRTVEKLLEKTPFPEPISRDTIVKIEEEKRELTIVNETLLEENDKMHNYIKELESKKDAKDIKVAQKQAGLLSKVDEFEHLTTDVSRMLYKLDSSVVTFIFNAFTGHNLEVEYYIYKRDIETAKANGYIDEDWNVLWDNTKIMKNLLESLRKLKKIIEDLDEQSYLALEKEYDIININNLSFWKSALDASIIT
ncbi:MAG: toll/interleukin-1 receptor domain-containing protein [Bacillota bacterium]